MKKMTVIIESRHFSFEEFEAEISALEKREKKELFEDMESCSTEELEAADAILRRISQEGDE